MRSTRIGLVGVVAIGAIAGLLASPAFADIFTWTDASGRFNVSNVAPPKDVHAQRIVQKETRPMSDAARAAAQASEMRALQDRVAELETEVDRANRRATAMASAPAAPPVVVVAPQAPAYAPPPATYAPSSDLGYNYDYGCDPLTFGCPAFGYPVFGYPVNVVVLNGKRFHRFDGFRGDRRFHQVPAHPAVPGRPVMPGRPGMPVHSGWPSGHR
jgi:uncharacterized protein DUF4124